MADMDDHSKNNDRKLDELLDNMLATYSSAEPRPGLETRILANLKEQSAEQASRWSGWMWIGGVAAAAAMILLITYFRRPQPQPAVPQVATHAPQKTNPAPELQTRAPALSATTSHPKHARRTLSTAAKTNEVAAVRREVFPSPSPLSEQEKLLLNYLARTPRQELIAQSHPDPPEEPEDNDSREPRLQNLNQVPQRNSNTR